MTHTAVRRIHRCLLFVPGSRPELLEKAHRSGADALIFDLEDSVPANAKQQARRHVVEALRRPEGLPVIVRANNADPHDLAADIEALAAAGPSLLEGILLPKAVDAAAVQTLTVLLTELESSSGVKSESLGIIPLIEDCLGLRNVFEIASASPRVAGIGLASAEEGDMIADLGGHWTPDSSVLMYPRGRLVCEARAAGIEWLIDGAFMNLADDAALRREAIMARNMGFVAKMAIHPSQIPTILETYSPTEEQIEDARQLVSAFQAAEADGRGAIKHQGKMVDRANIRVARRVLSLAPQSATRASPAEAS